MKIVHTCPFEKKLQFTVGTSKEILFSMDNPNKKTLFKKMNKEELLSFCDNEHSNNIRNDVERFVTWNEIKSFISENFKDVWDEEFEDQFYEKLVWATIPKSAIRARILNEEDEPDFYFFDAWCDVTEDSKIDIDCNKAKEVVLKNLRQKRQKIFEEIGLPQKLLPEIENILSNSTKEKLKSLRDITEPLKKLEATGYNDDLFLNTIKSMDIISDFLWKD